MSGDYAMDDKQRMITDAEILKNYNFVLLVIIQTREWDKVMLQKLFYIFQPSHIYFVVLFHTETLRDKEPLQQVASSIASGTPLSGI